MPKQDLNEENSKEDEPFGLGCALELFTEHKEVMEMIDNLSVIINSQINISERAFERFLYILSQYQEQPHLLDTHLDDILLKMISIFRSPEANTKLKHEIFKYMFVVVNVRGYKVVVRHLPHEVCFFKLASCYNIMICFYCIFLLIY